MFVLAPRLEKFSLWRMLNSNAKLISLIWLKVPTFLGKSLLHNTPNNSVVCLLFLLKFVCIFFFAARSSVSGAVDVSETSERIGIRTAEHKEIHALISYKGMYNPVNFFVQRKN